MTAAGAAASMAGQVVDRQPLDSAGYSGNPVERVTLADGRVLVRKRVSPEWDWLSRATNDTGRVVSMWDGGLFERLPAVVDHTTVAVERDESGWSVYMQDASASLVPHHARLDRDGVGRVLGVMTALHGAFRGERFPDLCGLEDRYRLLSPRTARGEQARGHSVGDTLARGWDAFSAHVPRPLADVIMTLAEEPAVLAEQLDRCEPTLVHGDVRLTNLGLTDERVVLIDWGERTGTAPGAVDLASFLGFDAERLEVPRDEVIAHFRRLSGDGFDERALQLALLGGFVQLGCHFGLGLVFAHDDTARAAATGELAWWIATAEQALETWSPTSERR